MGGGMGSTAVCWGLAVPIIEQRINLSVFALIAQAVIRGAELWVCCVPSSAVQER